MLALPLRRIVVMAVVCLLSVTLAQAEVTRVEIKSRVDVVGGRSFGSVGPYETLTGTIYFAADPANPHNKIIVDLDKAPRNAQGKVEFSSDLYIIKPKDPAKANGVLFFDVVNRGNKALLGVFSRGRDPTIPRPKPSSATRTS